MLINNSVIFETNETEKILTVTIIEDSILESEEDFTLRLSLDGRVDVNPVIFDRGSELIIIIEDDDGKVLIYIYIHAYVLCTCMYICMYVPSMYVHTYICTFECMVLTQFSRQSFCY